MKSVMAGPSFTVSFFQIHVLVCPGNMEYIVCYILRTRLGGLKFKKQVIANHLVKPSGQKNRLVHLQAKDFGGCYPLWGGFTGDSTPPARDNIN